MKTWAKQLVWKLLVWHWRVSISGSIPRNPEPGASSVPRNTETHLTIVFACVWTRWSVQIYFFFHFEVSHYVFPGTEPAPGSRLWVSGNWSTDRVHKSQEPCLNCCSYRFGIWYLILRNPHRIPFSGTREPIMSCLKMKEKYI
jgi:hypothetical protein